MPGYKCHLSGGLVVYLLLLLVVMCAAGSHQSLETLSGWLLATLGGALFPDIDTKSKGQKYFYWILLIILCWNIWQFKRTGNSCYFNIVAILSILSTLPILTPHRGITHKPWFIAIIAASLLCVTILMYPNCPPCYFLYTTFFTAGALSHIALDRSQLFRYKQKRK